MVDLRDKHNLMERPESLFRVKSFPLRFITIIHPNLIARLESFDPTEDDGYVFFYVNYGMQDASLNFN